MGRYLLAKREVHLLTWPAAMRVGGDRTDVGPWAAAGPAWPEKRTAAKLLLERSMRRGSALHLASIVEFEPALQMSVLVRKSLPLSLRRLGDATLINLLDHHVN